MARSGRYNDDEPRDEDQPIPFEAWRRAREREEEDGPGEHDARFADEEADTVQCPSCGKYVWPQATMCRFCGVHFEDEAWNSPGIPGASRLPQWALAAAVALIIALGWMLINAGRIL